MYIRVHNSIRFGSKLLYKLIPNGGLPILSHLSTPPITLAVIMNTRSLVQVAPLR
jgi:hypothetical protein